MGRWAVKYRHWSNPLTGSCTEEGAIGPESSVMIVSFCDRDDVSGIKVVSDEFDSTTHPLKE